MPLPLKYVSWIPNASRERKKKTNHNIHTSNNPHNLSIPNPLTPSLQTPSHNPADPSSHDTPEHIISPSPIELLLLLLELLSSGRATGVLEGADEPEARLLVAGPARRVDAHPRRRPHRRREHPQVTLRPRPHLVVARFPAGAAAAAGDVVPATLLAAAV